MNALETHVLQLIGENTSSPDVFSDTSDGLAQIRDSINDAVREMCLSTGSFVKTTHLSLRADTHVYNMPWSTGDEFAWVLECWDRSRRYKLTQTDLLGLSLIDFRWQDSRGPATHYAQLGPQRLLIYRAPASDAQVLELTCAAVPRRYTHGETEVPLQTKWQRSAVYYAVSEYFASRGDAIRAGDYLDKYIETAGLQKIHPQHAERQWALATRFDRWL